MASLVVLCAVLHLCAVGMAMRVELQLNETVLLNASREDPVALTLQLDSDQQVHELAERRGKRAGRKEERVGRRERVGEERGF